MGKIITANFSTGEKSVWATGLDQYDYGAVLRIHGLNLPPAVEIHFCLQETGGEAPRRVGTTRDGVTDVIIPDSMLENGDTTHDYNIYAWVYLTDETSGSTERRITMKVRSRSKPEAFDRPEDAELFREAIAAVNEASERAEDAEKSAEAWVHGHEDYPERGEDNARYYAKQAMMASANISDDAKKKIDEYIEEKKESFKGEPGEPGADGTTPHIGENNHWWIGETDTGVKAQGTDGITPHIGGNNHWWIGDVDTGVVARGEKGNDGVTPHIGANNHWYIGETDTGVTAQGADGYTPQKGLDYFDGKDGEPGNDGKSAYQYAQDGGYTGTEEEFTQKLATEYPTDVQINGTSIVLNKIANITAQNIRIVRDLMDEVAISDAVYLLGEQTELTITLPDDALTGQEITVVWYNAETPATLAISGNMLDFDYVPGANSRSEISALWDGTYWSLISNEQSVPLIEKTTEDTTREVVTDEQA